MNTLSFVRHPDWLARLTDWAKWRLTYCGGRRFIDQYLIRFSEREDISDFVNRKNITYCPAFAKAAINEVKDAIFQRMSDITRRGGSKSYQAAMFGNVDRKGSNMNTFIAQCILPELLTMGKVGIYVDMPKLDGELLRQNKSKRPYLYYYSAEQILSWSYDEDNVLTAILLEDCNDTYDVATGLPMASTRRYRYIYLEEKKVYVQYYNMEGVEDGALIVLNIPEIPFAFLKITDSLLTDVADYQIALLNIASSDLGYILKSNFPFYTEQSDTRMESTHLAQPGVDGPGKEKEIKVGAVHGRNYGKGMERPGFIHPSSEPLVASMAKQDQLKSEIRMLIHLAISNINPGRMASAESKGFDERSLEAGLSYIGLILEFGENEIAKFWANYVNEDSEKAVVKYPQRYSLKSEEERAKEASSCSDQMDMIPSIEFKRQMAKKIVEIVLGPKVSLETVTKIYTEIDKADAILGDVTQVNSDVQDGILSAETAAEIRCYPEDESKKAAKEHSEKLAEIAKHQTEGIRGVTSDKQTIKNDRTPADGSRPATRGAGK